MNNSVFDNEKLKLRIAEIESEREKMSPEQRAYWEEEERKCIASPYYFATNYLTLNGKPFITLMTEEEFNEMCKNLETGKIELNE